MLVNFENDRRKESLVSFIKANQWKIVTASMSNKVSVYFSNSELFADFNILGLWREE